jgi:hypothetical protein
MERRPEGLNPSRRCNRDEKMPFVELLESGNMKLTIWRCGSKDNWVHIVLKYAVMVT